MLISSLLENKYTNNHKGHILDSCIYFCSFAFVFLFICSILDRTSDSLALLCVSVSCQHADVILYLALKVTSTHIHVFCLFRGG